MKLQQGNYVLLDGIKEVEVIWQKNDKVCVKKFGIVDLDRINGLPITEDKLLKMGFKDAKGEYKNEWLKVNTKKRGVTFEINLKQKRMIVFLDGCVTDLPYLKHIHRLQNLVFELTDKWLTL